MSTAEQITPVQVLAKHRLDDFDGSCFCGEWSYEEVPDDGTDPEIATLHAAHVVAALTNAGKTIVDLPEHPDEEMQENDDEHGYVTWETGVGRATAHTDDTVTVESGYHFSVRPAEARGFAAALLAAARVAEGGERRG
ncbi:hypothetical protein GS481_02360 [Rhodococcus hoagii]|nr:hypothetical protein [Prescottella equi]NKR53014.1 hypothetical protein [Prescottella equi]